jgi:hypothetical protein
MCRFGENYNEDIMAELARATNGQFYDAESPDKLPAIFASELEGLQNSASRTCACASKAAISATATPH